MTAASTYAELFTLQAKAYTDKHSRPNGHHDTADMTLLPAQPHHANTNR
jgi:hypothetical protein